MNLVSDGEDAEFGISPEGLALTDGGIGVLRAVLGVGLSQDMATLGHGVLSVLPWEDKRELTHGAQPRWGRRTREVRTARERLRGCAPRGDYRWWRWSPGHGLVLQAAMPKVVCVAMEEEARLFAMA